MSFFRFITRSDDKDKRDKTTRTQATDKDGARVFDEHSKNTITEFRPKSFDEVAKIIDLLCEGKPAIVKLTELKSSTAQRVVDLLSGAIYAINGNICELEKDVYIFTPDGVRIG